MNNDEKWMFGRAKLVLLAMDLESLAEEFTRKTQASLLVQDMRERVVEILVRTDDPKFCNACHKMLHFCVLEKGHKGKHQEGDKTWKNGTAESKSKPTKKIGIPGVRPRSKKPKKGKKGK
jgi:hypothetical protein